MYKVELSKSALKQLKKLDKQTMIIITKWINKNLDGCESPREKGKALTGNLAGYWRYRVGDYRIVADIRDKEILILVVSVAHRREVYDK